MAGISVAVKHFNDITECPLCNEVFSDPRVLPCLDTFCFECITKWTEDQTMNGKLACPLCRKELRIPCGVAANGIERFIIDLPKNLFVQKVASARRLTNTLSGTNMCCDVCCEDSDDAEEKTAAAAKKAVAYCVECSQNICKQCCMLHLKMKISREHKVVELRENQPLQSEQFELPEDKCDKHPDENVKLYCYDCKLPTCTACLAADHQRHKFSYIKQLADEMRAQMKADIVSVATKVDECREVLTKLENGCPDFGCKIDAVAKLVMETAEKMKQVIDDYKAKLLNELELTRMDGEKKMKRMREELEASVLTLEVFKHYSEQVESRGTSCDVVTSAARLHTRANELIRHNVCGDFPRDCLLDFKFSSEFSSEQMPCLFGELCTENVPASRSTDVKLLGVIPSNSGRNVTGVTSLGNEVFMIAQDALNVDVYDAETFKLMRSLPTGFPKAKYSSLVACDRNKCLYMSTCCPSLIRRITVTTCNNKIQRWQSGKAPHGIALNQDTNLLVTCRDDRKIQEFTTNGILVREVALESDVTFPMHAVQLTGDQFGVTHSGSLHRFCVVGSDGRVVRSYGGPSGSGDGELLMPFGVTPKGCGDEMFVFDREKVVMLNTTTMSATQLRFIAGHEDGHWPRSPSSVHYDQTHGQLYIGDYWAPHRVIVVRVN